MTSTSCCPAQIIRVSVLLGVLLVCLSCLIRSVEGCSGAFSESCNNEQIVGTDLQASCGNGQGGYVTSSLNLDDHIVNNDGNLACNMSGGGGFSATCQSIALNGSSELQADCFNTAGNLIHTTTDLNTCIANIYGSLTWTCI